MKKTIFEVMTDKWNEKATDEFCHIKINDEIKNNYKNYLDGINLENKVIIDYGCGGGHLGKYLFKEKGISKYIGFDICEKSIKAAKKNLKSYDAEIIKVTEHIDFSKYNADVFISFECIQHFPTFQYLLTFLNTVNKSKIPEIILQIRIGNKTFVDKNVMTFMCKIPFEIIKNNLKNYEWINRHRYLLNNINKECIHFYSKDLVAINKAYHDLATFKNPSIKESKKIINNSIKDDIKSINIMTENIIKTVNESEIIGEDRENDVLRGSEFTEKEGKC